MHPTTAARVTICEFDEKQFEAHLQRWLPTIFGELHPAFHPTRSPENEERRRQRQESLQSGLWAVRLGIFVDGHFAGWSWAKQQDADSVVMPTSAILPEYRRSGLYTKLLDAVCRRVADAGFEIIYSQHNPANTPILVAKLKAGFVVCGYGVHDITGPRVELCRYLDENRRKTMDFRLGYAFADDEICQKLRHPQSRHA